METGYGRCALSESWKRRETGIVHATYRQKYAINGRQVETRHGALFRHSKTTRYVNKDWIHMQGVA